MDENFIEIAEALQQSMVDEAVDACRRAAPAQPLSPIGVCHNCHDPVPDGAVFCDYVEPGERDPACLIDWRARTGRTAAGL